MYEFIEEMRVSLKMGKDWVGAIVRVYGSGAHPRWWVMREMIWRERRVMRKKQHITRIETRRCEVRCRLRQWFGEARLANVAVSTELLWNLIGLSNRHLRGVEEACRRRKRRVSGALIKATRAGLSRRL